MNRTTEQQLLKSTSIIHTEDIYGNSEQATCFFIKRNVHNTEHHYLVTNSHVLKDKPRIHIYLDLYHEKTDTYTYYKKITLSPNHAVKYHPDYDLAILNIDSIKNRNTPEETYLYEPIDITMIPDNFDCFSAFQPILMLGYPSGIHDKTTNLPVARTGITSTPLASNYKGKPEFLINVPFLNGSSGSPVFTESNGSVYLIGIESSKLMEKVTVDRYKNRIYRSRKYTKEMETGLGIAIRSDRILDLF